MPQTIFTEHLVQLLRAIALQRQTGLLRIEQVGEKGTENGEIYFESGRMIRARAGDERGKSALKRINNWEHVIYSFNRGSRLSGSMRALPPSAELCEVAYTEKPQMSLLPVAAPQTERLVRIPRPLHTRKLTEKKEQPALAPGTVGQTPTVSPLEPTTLAHLKTVIPPVQVPQSFILHGETLEVYTPARPVRATRASQRWTTHLNSEGKSPLMPQNLPDTPQLDPLPEDEVLPGRLAIFRAKAVPGAATALTIQQMERRERIVFILLDGQRTIQHIARLTHHPENEVERILAHLTKEGYTEYIQG